MSLLLPFDMFFNVNGAHSAHALSLVDGDMIDGFCDRQELLIQTQLSEQREDIGS